MSNENTTPQSPDAAQVIAGVIEATDGMDIETVAAAVVGSLRDAGLMVAERADVERAVAAFGNGYAPDFVDRLREALV